RLLRLLDTIATADPAQPVGRLELLTEDERRCLFDDGNGTPAAPAAGTVPALFAAQAAATPDAVAVAAGDRPLSYAELDAWANRLAHDLISRGAGPEQLVALALPRSVEQVVAVLAVLKAGAAYLPVDPEYPKARIAAMLEDAAPLLLIDDPETVR